MKPATATPVYFGPPERPLFGWLHRPPETTADVGLVICAPFGYEAVCTHRTLRHLAIGAALAGVATLRFDYDGDGDSAGSQSDPGRLASWVNSVREAVVELQRQTGVQRICLLGVRLGALLALLAADGLVEICACAAIAPVISGRAYLRELRALSMARAQSTPPGTAEPGALEVAGFVLTDETREALSGIDLAQLGATPLRSALILDRDDIAASGTLTQRLESLGVEVTTEKFTGYVQMMLDAHESEVPSQMLERAIQWISRLATFVQREAGSNTVLEPRSTARMLATSDLNSPIIRESAMSLGDGPMFCILCEPHQATVPVRGVLLLLNSGAVHHIGPNRMFVEFSRIFAGEGFAVLRLDLSGIGDSFPRPGKPDNEVYGSSALEDVAAAVRFLRERFDGADIHCIGICSGAYHGLKAAAQGQPLRSVTVINPLTFFWEPGMSLGQPAYQLTAEAIRYRQTALKLGSWLKVLRGRVNSTAALKVILRRAAHRLHDQRRELCRWLRLPLKNDLAAELRIIAKHHTMIFFVFSASDPGLAMLHEQGGGLVKRLQVQGRLCIDVIDHADHTFTARWAQRSLLKILDARLTTVRS